jgi:hypothetical protein
MVASHNYSLCESDAIANRTLTLSVTYQSDKSCPIIKMAAERADCHLSDLPATAIKHVTSVLTNQIDFRSHVLEIASHCRSYANTSI